MIVDISEKIKQHFADSIQTKILAADALVEPLARAGNLIVHCLLSNNKILTCGSGGSALSAQHFAEILLNRFNTDRPSLPAVSLVGNAATLTAIADDFHYTEIFAKQIEALGQPDDVLLVLSVQGHSKNIIDAVEMGHARGLRVIAFTGGDGGEVAAILNSQVDVEIRVPSGIPARIQETHWLAVHCLCDVIDQLLFATENE